MSAILIIALVGWLAIVLFLLAALRAAARADRAADRHARELDSPVAPAPEVRRAELRSRRRRRRLVAAEVVALVAVIAAAAVSSRASDWDSPAVAGLLALLALTGDLRPVRARQLRVSAAFPALVVAMAVLGPAPAVAIGVTCALADAALTRPRVDELVCNVLGYAAPALFGGLAIRAAGGVPDGGAVWPIVAVIGVYVAATALNFLLVAGHGAILAGGGLREMARASLLPVVPWEAGAAVVTAAVVYVYSVRGDAGIAVLAVAGFAFQWLLRTVLEGQRRGRVIERQAEELGIQQVGMLELVLRLMALRDPSAVRHAAAVAHDARALARAAGLSEREQEVVHTAGLLHDIGQQAFPDALLVADREVDEAGRRLIRSHPLVGARLLRQVAGLWEVADAVEAHHERIDGTGYPHGLSGSRIPRTARIIAIAELYDRLTSEDSYRGAQGEEWAAQELMRVAGTQLDRKLVELFLTLPHPRVRPSLLDELPSPARARTAFDPRPATG